MPRSFAVATHSFLLNVELDNNWNVTNSHIIGKGYYYGIALTTDNNLIAYRGGNSLERQTEPQLQFISTQDSFKLQDRVSLKGEWGDIHQISYANEGVYIANTKFNTLAYLNLQTNEFERYKVDGLQIDKNHVNSIFPAGQQIYVIFHNRAHKESEVGIFSHSPGKGFSLEHRLSLWNLGCHNIFIDENYLIYNASRAHDVVVVDLKKDKRIRRISFKGWHTKGLSIVDNYIILGLSEYTLRDKRATSKGYLVVLDRRSFNVIARVDLNLPYLPHPAGNVNEVRSLSGDERGHSNPQAIEHNWSELKLGNQHLFSLTLNRSKTKFLLPLRRLKARLLGWYQ